MHPPGGLAGVFCPPYNLSRYCKKGGRRALDVIRAENLIHSYAFEGSRQRSLDGLSLTVEQGEFLAILGHNGCGKTTLARHINALLELQGGELTVASLDAGNRANVWKIREKAGMVFQNPDNQFVSSVIEEDLAFGPRNFGVPEEEIPARVRAALAAVGMSGFEKRSPHLLSGGQKQRIAIAGVLAVEPDIMIFDEVTAMLDPEGRRDVLDTIGRLHEAGKTVLMISHYIEEAVNADRVALIHDGKLLAVGTPRQTLTDPELLRRTGLTPPLPVRLYFDLKARGRELPFCPLTERELVDALC